MLRLHRPTAYLGRLASATLILGALVILPAHAEEAAELHHLLRNGRQAEALTRVEAALRARPNDPQMRFVKGLILVEQTKFEEAIALFIKLAEDYPGVPEPYNNLAVLYATTGHYEKARAALDAAIRIKPGYATAHENLGDVYAKLASQAYQKAVQLNAGNTAAKTKLQAMGSLLAAGEGKKDIFPTSAPTVKPATASAAGTSIASMASPSGDAEAEIVAMVNNWALSWSDKNVTAYLAAYANDFLLPPGQSRAAWENSRRARIADKGTINVKIESLRMAVNANTATVNFVQAYSSDRYRDQTRKTLVLTKQNGAWKIKEERAGT